MPDSVQSHKYDHDDLEHDELDHDYLDHRELDHRDLDDRDLDHRDLDHDDVDHDDHLDHDDLDDDHVDDDFDDHDHVPVHPAVREGRAAGDARPLQLQRTARASRRQRRVQHELRVLAGVHAPAAASGTDE